MKQAP